MPDVDFHAMVEALPVLAWTADATGWIHMYSQRWYDYTGTKPDDMKGWGWRSCHHPDMLEAVLVRWRHSIATGKPFEMVFPLRGADGVFRPFLTRVAPVFDAGGKLSAWVGANIDVSGMNLSGTLAAEMKVVRRVIGGQG